MSREKCIYALNVYVCELLLTAADTNQLGIEKYFNVNINVNKYSSNLRKIKQIEIKCIFERKEYRF